MSILFQSVFGCGEFAAIVRHFSAIYVIQGAALGAVLYLACRCLYLLYGRARDRPGAFAKARSALLWIRRSGVCAAIAGPLWRLRLVCVDEKVAPLTQADLADLTCPVYAGVLILCIAVLAFTVLEFVVSGKGE